MNKKISYQELYIDSVQDIKNIVNQLDNTVKYIGIIDIPYNDELYIKANRLRYHKYNNPNNVCWFTPGYIKINSDKGISLIKIGSGSEEPLWYFSNNIYENIIDELDLKYYGTPGIYLYSKDDSKDSVFIPIDYQWQIDTPIANKDLYKEGLLKAEKNIKQCWKKFAKKYQIDDLELERVLEFNFKFFKFTWKSKK